MKNGKRPQIFLECNYHRPILFVSDRLWEEEESARPLKEEYRLQLFNLLKQGYLDDVDPTVLFEDENKSELPGLLAKGSKFLKRKGNLLGLSKK